MRYGNLVVYERCELLWLQDGYAVIASDGPGDYEIIGDARCGDSPDYTVKPGTVAYITTGGMRKPWLSKSAVRCGCVWFHIKVRGRVSV